MKLWIYGFFMSWGMFLTIPNPCKIWDEKARDKMLLCFPFLGILVGALWALAAWLFIRFDKAFLAVVIAAIPWLTTGFMHLDGYMDVCDAIMSRRDLATRQKILKDSHCGAFAVICVCLLIAAQWGVFVGAKNVDLLSLGLVPVATRCCACMAVTGLRPMATSQYSAMGKKTGAVIAGAAMLVLCAGIAPFFRGLSGLAPAAAAAVYWLCCWHGFRQLDGMNGDISGFALTVGELAGCAAAVMLS